MAIAPQDFAIFLPQWLGTRLTSGTSDHDICVSDIPLRLLAKIKTGLQLQAKPIAEIPPPQHRFFA